MTKPLEGKVAIVTGGSRGIGAAIVRRLAMDGATVAFTFANSKEKAEAIKAEIELKGGRALAIQADSADAAALQRAIDKAADHFGSIDILVNNAGILLLPRNPAHHRKSRNPQPSITAQSKSADFPHSILD